MYDRHNKSNDITSLIESLALVFGVVTLKTQVINRLCKVQTGTFMLNYNLLVICWLGVM